MFGVVVKLAKDNFFKKVDVSSKVSKTTDSDNPILNSTLFTLQAVNSKCSSCEFDVSLRFPTRFAEYKLRNLHPFSRIKDTR